MFLSWFCRAALFIPNAFAWAHTHCTHVWMPRHQLPYLTALYYKPLKWKTGLFCSTHVFHRFTICYCALKVHRSSDPVWERMGLFCLFVSSRAILTDTTYEPTTVTTYNNLKPTGLNSSPPLHPPPPHRNYVKYIHIRICLLFSFWIGSKTK